MCVDKMFNVDREKQTHFLGIYYARSEPRSEATLFFYDLFFCGFWKNGFCFALIIIKVGKH